MAATARYRPKFNKNKKCVVGCQAMRGRNAQPLREVKMPVRAGASLCYHLRRGRGHRDHAMPFNPDCKSSSTLAFGRRTRYRVLFHRRASRFISSPALSASTASIACIRQPGTITNAATKKKNAAYCAAIQPVLAMRALVKPPCGLVSKLRPL